MGRKVIVHIHQLASKRGLSLRKLSRLTDIRHAALVELANGNRQNINFGHIERIAETLEIDDIREIISIINTDS